MWRFVLISFLFLGAAFYVLSGGSSYEPAPNSIQAQARLPKDERIALYRAPEPKPQPEVSRSLDEVETVLEQLSETEDNTDQLALTLAAVRTDAAGILENEATRPKAELLTMALPETIYQPEDAVDAAVAAALGEVSFDQSQIRWVKEPVIELRAGPGLSFDLITQVTKGSEVAILEDPGHGWLNVQVVEGFQTGWVAEWLLIKPE